MSKVTRLPTRLLRRNADSHKGDYGHIFILAGSARCSGAAVLAAAAAMRTGAGLVTIGIPKSINNALLKIKPIEIMTLPLAENSDGSISRAAKTAICAFTETASVLVLGPGLGKHASTQRLIRDIIVNAKLPAVLDADGINAFDGYRSQLKKHGPDLIITPHAGEMARLTGSTVQSVQQGRKEVAQICAREYNITVVLKGHGTIVAGPAGEFYINATGNPGMATAGSGDVLSGVIAALMGQGIKPFDAAKYGVYLHGLAGDLAARDKTQPGMIASDIIDAIPDAIKKTTETGRKHSIRRRSSVGRAAVL